jgi:16S rRNA (cytosine967-C5)-methyltransferase
MVVVSAVSPAWSVAVALLARWHEHGERVDALLERPEAQGLGRAERARCQYLLFGALRHRGRVGEHLAAWLPRPPRPVITAVLEVAGYELIDLGAVEGGVARVVHHAVEGAKALATPPEARMVNAVARKLATALAAEVVPGANAPPAEAARWYSHPRWLVERWVGQFGPAVTCALLEWNQLPAPVYLRWRAAGIDPAGVAGLASTRWPGFYSVEPGAWEKVEPLLTNGAAVVQDPATRLAVDLLAPEAGEAVLDLCAAPGGKSVALADALGGSGRVVAWDLPGPRARRLQENLARIQGVEVALVLGDLLKAGRRLLAEHGLPETYPAVLLDAPCSNTGVMRHRVDVKWRLQPDDFRRHARQQLALLQAAARLVAPGGRLVYSTCSLDSEENERVAGAFARQSRGAWELADEAYGRPWDHGHDGAAAFLLRQRA